MKQHLSNKRMLMILLHHWLSPTVAIALVLCILWVSGLSLQEKAGLSLIVTILISGLWTAYRYRDIIQTEHIESESGAKIPPGWIRSATVDYLRDDGSCRSRSLDEVIKSGGMPNDVNDWIFPITFYGDTHDYFLGKRKNHTRHWKLISKEENRCQMADHSGRILSLPIEGKGPLFDQILWVTANFTSVADFLLKTARDGFKNTEPSLSPAELNNKLAAFFDSIDGTDTTHAINTLKDIGFL